MKRRCGWCGIKCGQHIYASRTVSTFFSGAHGGRSAESVSTIYFCDVQHRLNYFKEM